MPKNYCFAQIFINKKQQDDDATEKVTLIYTKKPIAKHYRLFCRGDRIRTCDHLVPNQVRYRTALHPERLASIFFISEDQVP